MHLLDESTILRVRLRLENHKLTEQNLGLVNEILIQRGLMLKTGAVVDATLIAAPSSTKNNATSTCRGIWCLTGSLASKSRVGQRCVC